MKGDSAHKGGEAKTAKAEQAKNNGAAHEKKDEKHTKGEKERE